MCHAIDRAREIKRGNLDLNYFDLKMIEIMIGQGLGKDVTCQHSVINKEIRQRIYHIRYGGKLLKPVVDIDRDNFIITFLPCGKRESHKKYLNNRKLTKCKQL